MSRHYRQPAISRGPRCGTSDGYNDHQREKTWPCRDCEDAQAIYVLRWRRRKMLGLPIMPRGTARGGRLEVEERLEPPRWFAMYGDMAQAGAGFYAGVVMGA